MAQVISIECTDSNIIFHLNQVLDATVFLEVYSPNTSNPKLLYSESIHCNGDLFKISRFLINDLDGIYLKYEHHLSGINFVDTINISNTLAYPVYSSAISKKGLRCVDLNDALNLGIHHTVIDLPIQDLIRTYPEGNTNPYSYQGFEYHINFETVDRIDKLIQFYTRNKIHSTINLLVCTPVDIRMRNIVQHPNYESRGRMSAINVTSDESCRYLEAACNYLASRYTTNPQSMQVDGIILANEINVQGIWANASNYTCEQYLAEYTRALRIAWHAGVKYWKNWRVYISLECHWGDPLKEYAFFFKKSEMYPGRDCLLELNKNSTEEGNFNWNIAFHPYASNLLMPDFYNDDKSTFDENSFVISFKNLSMLINFIHGKLSKWNGDFRRVILSEQGFNSAGDIALEHVQAAAYGRAFKEVMKYKEIEAFIYHSHADNPNEEGLKLGLRRSADFKSISNLKPIYSLFKTIENKTYDGKPLWQHF